MRLRGLLTYVVLSIVIAVLAGCSGMGSGGAGGKLQVTTTTGMIADIVRNVGGDHVAVTALMGPGVDPHLYKASEGDIGKLGQAQIIFYNGLHLEGKMTEIFEQMGEKKPIIAVSERIDKAKLLSDPNGNIDPHVWFDVKLWMSAAEVVRDRLAEADPAHKADYEQNAAAYLKQLEDLDRYARERLVDVPKERRVLVTAHDAFGYFGAAYDIEVVGLQGISTDTEFGLGDIQKLVSLLADRKIKAVFVESSVPKRSIEAVVEGAKAKGHGVAIGGELFSDAMGAEGTKEGTYVGMVRHNVDTVVNALK